MVKRCIYCKAVLEDSSVIDICGTCGVGVWGEKMFSTIINNMETARDVGDLYQGSVSDQGKVEKKKPELVPFESQEEPVEKEVEVDLEERVADVLEPEQEIMASENRASEELGLEEERVELAPEPESATFIIDNLERGF